MMDALRGLFSPTGLTVIGGIFTSAAGAYVAYVAKDWRLLLVTVGVMFANAGSATAKHEAKIHAENVADAGT